MILDELVALLGGERVLPPPPASALSVSGRDIGQPLARVLPQSTEEVAAIVKLAAAARVRVVAVGAATAYWDPNRTAAALLVDTRELVRPFALDEVDRVVHVGAGVSLRDIDRAARAVGLTLAARPDAAGDTPAGSLYAVGSSAGLGLGVCAPVDQLVAATLVLADGKVARVGASHALHGRPGLRHGSADALGLFAAASGRAAIVTEVALLLQPAPHIVTVRASGRAPKAALLAIARDGFDAGTLESYRIECTPELSLMARTLGRGAQAAADAQRAAESLAAAWRAAGLSVEPLATESERARRGLAPDDEYHWLFPVAEHRARLLGAALWGVDVSASWRDSDACAARLWQLFEALSMAPLVHRRFAIYPGPHAVNVGVHALVAPDAVERAVAIMKGALPDLLAHGAIPYRRGHLWEEALRAYRKHGDLADELLALLDPRAQIGGGPAPRE